MKRKSLILVVCVLSIVLGAANAETYMWVGGVGDWEVSTNWDPEGIPSDINQDYAIVNNPGDVCNVNQSVTCLFPFIGWTVGYPDGPSYMNFNSGASLSTNSEMIIGYADGGYGIVNVYENANLNLASLRMGSGGNAPSKGVLNVDGGTAEVLWFGTYLGSTIYSTSTGGYADINVFNDGVFTISGRCFVDPNTPVYIGENGKITVGGTSNGTLKVRIDPLKPTVLDDYITAGKVIGIGDCTLTTDTSGDIPYRVYYCEAVCSRLITGDLSGDCYVNMDDLSLMALGWLDCTAITDPGCTP